MPYTEISQLDHAQEDCEEIPLDTVPALNLAERDRLADPFAGGSRASRQSLSDYFTQQHRMFEDTELAALLEPRRIQAPPGYHSTNCVSAGLFVLLGSRVVRAARGLPHIPTEIAAHVVAYQAIRYLSLIHI